MAHQQLINADAFPCGNLITTQGNAAEPRRLLFASAYFTESLGFDSSELINRPLAELLTRASSILFDSYVIPLLLHQGHCEEIQLELLTAQGVKIPVVVNARLVSDPEPRIFWSLFNATQRDRLYQELVDARRRLEENSERLHALSITDDLTGLLNRRALRLRGEAMLAQAQRSGTPTALLVLDIDHFKEVNDLHGHAAGDTVLAELGQLLQTQARIYDVVARFGGEEFVMVLPDTTLAQTRTISRRLHQAIQVIRIADKALTVSIGATVISARANKDLSFEDVFAMADRALYEAKGKGRNCTAFA